LLNVLFDEIRSIARRKGLTFVSFAPSTIKKFTCGNGRASKKEVATVVVSKFPELKVYLTQDREWKERFHQNMFDAVAVGVMTVDRIRTAVPSDVGRRGPGRGHRSQRAASRRRAAWSCFRSALSRRSSTRYSRIASGWLCFQTSGSRRW